MKHPIRILFGAAALSCALSLAGGDALAQRRGAPPASDSAPSLSVTYGSMWGGNVSTYSGKLRAGTGPSLGLALDIPVAYDSEVELSYTRQDGNLDWDSRGITPLSDMSVNHYQIGALRPFPAGGVQPFVIGGLGATHFSPKESSATINDEEYALDSFTRFSLHFGAGFRAYFGQAKKVGIRASFKFMPTLYDTGAGLWFGSGGASVGVSGSAIWQYEIAGGLTVKFGS